MAGHPADIRRAPVHVAVVVVEDVLVRDRRKDEVAAGGVQHALRLAGRARGVEDEERILRVHLLAGALGGHLRCRLVVVDVAARHHVDGRPRTAHDDDMVDAAGPLDRRVDIGLERHLAAAAQALVGGDDEGRLRVLDAAGERIRREAAEDHGMDGAEPCAGEHRIGRLGDHRHVDRDPVALADAAVAHDVRHAADLVVQLAIGDMLRFGRVVALPDDRHLVAARRKVPVDAVIGDVGRAVLEPADRDLAWSESRVLDPGIGLEPVDPLALLAPEALGVPHRGLVLCPVAGLVDIGAAGPFGRDVVTDFRGVEGRIVHGPIPHRLPQRCQGKFHVAEDATEPRPGSSRAFCRARAGR